MEVPLLLDCAHIVIIQIESVLHVPPKGKMVICPDCSERERKQVYRMVDSAGTPYRTEFHDVEQDGDSLLEDK